MSVSISIPSQKSLIRQDLGFGESDPGHPLKSTTRQKVHAVAILTLIGTSLLAAGAIVGCIFAAPVAIALSSLTILALGAASGGGLGFLGIVGIAIFSVTNLQKAPPSVSHIKDVKAPKIGEFTKNHILSTEHAKESSEWKLELLRNAEQSVELSGNFCGGKLFREALDIMDLSLEKSKGKDPAKKSAKLQIHLTASSNLIESEDQAKLAALRKKWPKNFHYLETGTKVELSPVLRSVENHAKIMVVDGKYFLVGGSGLQEEMGRYTGEENIPDGPRPFWKKVALAPGYRDMDFVGEGPAARTWRVEFFKLWHIWSEKMSLKDPHAGYFPLDDAQPKAFCKNWEDSKTRGDVVENVDYKPLISDPEKPNAITAEHIHMLKTAKKTALIANLTFNSTPEVHEAFNNAGNRIKLDLITNGNLQQSPWNHGLWARAHDPHLLPLLMGRKITKHDTIKSLEKEYASKNNPAKIHLYAQPRIMAHTKAAVFDEDSNDKEAIVVSGSYNFGIKSHGLSDRGCDYEACQVMKSKKLAQRVAKRLNRDIALSQPVSVKDAHKAYNNTAGRLQAKLCATFLV